MIVAIDASNIRAGGGITHLRELLTYADPEKYGVEKVIVWGGKKTIDQLPDFTWLVKSHVPMLDGNLIMRLFWQKLFLSRWANKQCDVLFIPGANYSGSFQPYVTMFQNSLPFEYAERARFGYSLTNLRYRLLEFSQSRSFANASSVVFLTKYAKELVEGVTGKASLTTKIIPHGVLPQFSHEPDEQRDISEYTKDKPYKFLYMSTLLSR